MPKPYGRFYNLLFDFCASATVLSFRYSQSRPQYWLVREVRSADGGAGGSTDRRM